MSENELQAPPTVTIDTERLQLKTVAMDDLDDFMPMITDLRVMKWSSRPPVETREQATQWISERCLGRSRDVFNFTVREKAADGTPTNVVGIMGFSQEPGTVGYMMKADYAGKGYATEALKALTPAFFARTPEASEGGTGVDAITAYIDTQNPGSRRVLEKCGYTRCEYLTDQAIHVRNNPHNHMVDSYVYRIARPGKTLEELGLIAGQGEDEPPEPPVQ